MAVLCRIHYAYGGSIYNIFDFISYKESHDEELLRLSTFTLHSSTATQLCLYSGNNKKVAVHAIYGITVHADYSYDGMITLRNHCPCGLLVWRYDHESCTKAKQARRSPTSASHKIQSRLMLSVSPSSGWYRNTHRRINVNFHSNWSTKW